MGNSHCTKKSLRRLGADESSYEHSILGETNLHRTSVSRLSEILFWELAACDFMLGIPISFRPNCERSSEPLSMEGFRSWRRWFRTWMKCSPLRNRSPKPKTASRIKLFRPQ